MTATREAQAEEIVADNNRGVIRSITRAQATQIVLVLLGMMVLFTIINPDAFLSVFNFRSIIVNASIFIILGVGVTFVIVTAGIDLSIGSVLVFASVMSALVMESLGTEGWAIAAVGAVVAVLAGALWGLINGFLIAKANVPAFIVTLGTMGMALGISQVITGGIDLYNVPEVLVDTVGFGDIVWQVPTLAVIALVIAVLGGILLHKTKFGLYTYALGSNMEASRRIGIRVDKQLIWVYIVSGVCAGIGGYLSLALYQQTTIAGNSLTNLAVIAGVVIGGTSLFGGVGTIFGTVIGLLIPVTLRQGFVISGVQAFWQEVVVGIFLIGAVYIDGVRRARARRSSGKNPKPM
ncbi:MAG: ABC transporter permease, partial [Actinomycetota bacterium]|nr:ABC transporter permease [Actinomycetota bacterium]